MPEGVGKTMTRGVSASKNPLTSSVMVVTSNTSYHLVAPHFVLATRSTDSPVAVRVVVVEIENMYVEHVENAVDWWTTVSVFRAVAVTWVY